MWNRAISLIRRHRTFLVTSHVFPDGDAVGSQLALAQVLRKLGKKVLVVNDHPFPRAYRFLDPRATARVHTKKLAARIARCDVAVVVDAGSLDRVGRVGPVIESAGLTTVCIDHHKTNSRFADVNVVDPEVASTGEMVYRLARGLHVPITRRLAERLFVAVATDTGWFRFPNTTPETLRDAAELVTAGARPDRLYRSVYETLPWRRMDLMKRVLGTLGSACNGRIAYFYATEKMLRETQARHEDTEGFIDIPRVVRTVQLIFFFREVGSQVKVSIRSKDGPSVEALAKRHGGGGHARAAGIAMKGPLRRVIRTILAEAEELLRAEAR
jgi:phosphoesterase RecJ-like protein